MIRYFWLSFLLCFACEERQPLLTYTIAHLQYDQSDCQGEREACFMANINFPEFTGLNTSMLMLPTRLVANNIIDALGMGDVESNAMPDIGKALENVAESLEEVKSANNYTNGWTADVQTIAIYEDDTLLVFAMELMTFFGGAHPNTNRRYYNLNRLTGKPYNSPWMIKLPAIKQRAEHVFRELNHLGPDDSLNENGFLFTNNEFQLPSNFGIKGDSLILFYNRYEIAPYAYGPVELTISIN